MLMLLGFFVPFPSHLCLFGFKIKFIKLENRKEMFFNLFLITHACIFYRLKLIFDYISMENPRPMAFAFKILIQL